MRRSLWLLLPVILTGCAAVETGVLSTPPMHKPLTLKDYGPAPELAGDTWINAQSPLRLDDLRGKVVALEMWTFGCINCQHVIPTLRDWHREYASQGLIIIGNHFPEFAYEADLAQLVKFGLEQR